MIFYDLHIHSALSPCSDDDMTLNNIINMACIKELNLISVSDHNTLKQLKHFEKLAEGKIDFLYGVEIQTNENIHILGYFHEEKYLEDIQDYLDDHLIKVKNNTEYYGNQYVFVFLQGVMRCQKTPVFLCFLTIYFYLCIFVYMFLG